ncbi:hypothetical protein F8388_008498 [Cannabis sativa]|uniref:Carbamoyl-phosphate synthetase large subunit oligomerisation domain-containing protein n=1 Tax=Cannabis sativa TaxID=3483 RepID=A0A7J6EJW5_CANSA|nr:hypothetical protein F8388_008498 [Cannabis sativa]
MEIEKISCVTTGRIQLQSQKIIPRFAFEKFPGSQPILTTQMKLVDRIHDVCSKGMKIDGIHELSYIDIWFLTQLKELVDVEQFLLARIKLVR